MSTLLLPALAVCSGSPLNPANANFACGNSTPPGVRCNATCSAGYSAGGSGGPSAVCGSTGQWSAVTGNCTQIGGWLLASMACVHDLTITLRLCTFVESPPVQSATVPYCDNLILV